MKPTFSVSHLKAHLSCAQLAHYRYEARRGEPEPEVFALGSAAHLALATILNEPGSNERAVEAAEASLVAAAEAASSFELPRDWPVVRDILLMWRKPEGWEVLGTETPLSIEVGGATIVGTLDALVRHRDLLWHVQHKTLGQSVPCDIYAAAQETDWHECLYAGMARVAFPGQWGGTQLNIIRKLSRKMFGERPEAGVVFMTLLPKQAHIERAIADAAQVIDDILGQRSGRRPIIRNRSACLSGYRNSLCPYKGVCDGYHDLSSPRYVDVQPRYPDGVA